MEKNLNNYLKEISSNLSIKKGSEESKRNDESLDVLIKQLLEYFGNDVEEVVPFGSYSRGTKLSKKFDKQSDIDILVKFDNKKDDPNPQFYINKLKKFAQLKYPVTSVTKDDSCVVIELHHTKFDLVPSIYGDSYDDIFIPDEDNDWIESDPEKFEKKLTKADKKYNFIVKPIITLIKYWNFSHGSPFRSFDIEDQILDLDFSDDDLEEGFLSAIYLLSSHELSGIRSKKVDILQKYGKQVEEYLEDSDISNAKKELHKILPELK
jgi:predicted nucleotidyltransferase